MPELNNIILRPLVTEKSTALKERGQYVFEVDSRANKIEIRKAIEGLFKVKVVRVHTQSVRGKTKRFRGRETKRSDWKKAIATLKVGDKIEFFEGV